jgi:glutathione S-transferase
VTLLYSFRRCPYAMRARLALKVAALPVDVREVVLRDKPVELLALSPKATVPVLQTADGTVIDQSLDIMRWALAQNDPHGWLTAGDAAEGDALIALNDGPFKAALDRYKYPQRHPGTTPQSAREEAVAVLLEALERRLAQHAQLQGPRSSLADAALFPFVRQFAQVDAEWFGAAPLPGLQRWVAGWQQQPLFHAVMAKLPRWQPGDAPVQL